MTWNAMVEPMLMKPSRQAIIVVTVTEIRGIEVRLSTYPIKVNKWAFLPVEGRMEWSGTLLRYGQNGKPRSRAKAQIEREDVAMKPMTEKVPRLVMMAAMIVLPETERPVACKNISMNE